MVIAADGAPSISSCIVDGEDKSDVVFRVMNPEEHDARLANARLRLKFFRRGHATRQLKQFLTVISLMEFSTDIKVFGFIGTA